MKHEALHTVLRFIAILLVVVSFYGTTALATGWLTKFKTVMASKAGKMATVGSFALFACTMLSCDNGLDVGQLSELLVEQGDGDTAAVIKIGMNYDGSRFPNAKDGAELAVEEINTAGGGVLIELVAIDNENNLTQSVRLTTSLIDEHQVHVLIGPERSTHAIIVGEIAQRYSVPMLTTTATNPEVTSAGKYVFMASFTDIFQALLMAKFAVGELEAKTVAILTQSNDVYSKGLSKAFADNFTLLGGEVVTQQFYPADAVNFAPQLLPILVQKPDIVFVPGFVPEAPLAVKQARELGIEATFIGGDGWGGAGLVAEGGEALEGSFFSDHFHATPSEGMSEDTLQFIENFVAKYGESPISRSASGYDAVYLVAQAITEAGSLEGDAIKDALAAITNYSGATAIASFTEQRHAVKSAVVKTIKDGEIVFFQLVEP